MRGFDMITNTQLTDRIWLLEEENASGYLVIGDSRSLLIDTMFGMDDLGKVVRSLTDLPVTVINTHGHGDHIGGDIYFDTVCLHPADIPMVEKEALDPEFRVFLKEKGLKLPSVLPLHAGDTFDLGNRTAEIIPLPGHTPGSVCVLLREDRILFTGDAVNRFLWLQLDCCLPPDECLKELEKIGPAMQRADRILHGHAHGFEEISLYGDLKNALKELVLQNGTQLTDSDPDYEWFGGTDKKHPFADGNGWICYSREKLSGKKEK